MISIKKIKEICHSDKLKRNLSESKIKRSYDFHRNLAVYLSFIFLNFMPKITPNQISLLMLLFGFTGIFLFLSVKFPLTLIGLLLIYFSFLLDKVDGDIARYRKVFSLYGKYLDEIYHLFPQTLIYFAVGIHEYIQNNHLIFLMLSFICYCSSIANRILPKFALMLLQGSAEKNNNSNIQNEKTIYKNKLLRAWISNFLVCIRFDLILAGILLYFFLEYLGFYSASKLYITVFFFIQAFAQIVRLLIINKSIWEKLI